MDQKQAAQKVKQFAERVHEFLPAFDAFLYGSRAKGINRTDSDIDVAIVVDEYFGDLFSMKAKLFRIRREIDVRIEPLLIERKHDPANFLSEIMSTGKAIASYS
jgi:predicted nucleotidyltransferase